jgi:hypothetical protein
MTVSDYRLFVDENSWICHHIGLVNYICIVWNIVSFQRTRDVQISHAVRFEFNQISSIPHDSLAILLF